MASERFAIDRSSVHVEIDPDADVHPVVRDGRIHPRVVRAKEPDLELQELHVVHCLLKHGADVHLGPVGHQVLQDLQPLIDPLPPLPCIDALGFSRRATACPALAFGTTSISICRLQRGI